MNLFESMALVSRRLNHLGVPYAFLGGSIVPLLVDDPNLHQIRPTLDVDIIVHVITQYEYAAFEQRLRQEGFVNDMSEGAPLCRYLLEGHKVDIMPISSSAIGLSSRWFPQALSSAEPRFVGIDETVPVIRPSYFLATKLEAFKDRGNKDYQASHDLEDLLAVIDGCERIVDQIAQEPQDLREYLAHEFSELLDQRAFREALPGHLPGGSGEQARLPLILARLKSISELKPLSS